VSERSSHPLDEDWYKIHFCKKSNKELKKNYMTRTDRSKDHYETPDYLFKLIEKEVQKQFKRRFTLDPAASEKNAKCNNYFTKKDNGLKQDWQDHTVFCNPPYTDIETWVEKCYEEGQKKDTIVVMLIPSRIETRYFHNFCFKAYLIYSLKGRVSFLLNGEKQTNNNHGSIIVVFKRHSLNYPKFRPFYHKPKDIIKQECDIEKWI
jgi:site-specific DNA-methyltransferase (adenine-specific)